VLTQVTKTVQPDAVSPFCQWLGCQRMLSESTEHHHCCHHHDHFSYHHYFSLFFNQTSFLGQDGSPKRKPLEQTNVKQVYYRPDDLPVTQPTVSTCRRVKS